MMYTRSTSEQNKWKYRDTYHNKDCTLSKSSKKKDVTLN